MRTLPSFSRPGLVWSALPQPDDSPLWEAHWQGKVYDNADDLLAALGMSGTSADVRFEAWLGFGLGFDGFNPIINPQDWAAILDRGPINPQTGAQDGIVVAPSARTAPFEGEHGLEGLVIHPATGHVMRALTEGFPARAVLGTPYDIAELPLLIALTATPEAA